MLVQIFLNKNVTKTIMAVTMMLMSTKTIMVVMRALITLQMIQKL